MQIVGIIVTGFISLLIGMVGFPQIIGCIKYYHLRTPAKNFGTIFIWVIVLGIVGIIAHVFFIDYVAGYYVGTVIAFIKSFVVRPDNELATDSQNATEDVVISSIQTPDIASAELDELYKKLKSIQSAIHLIEEEKGKVAASVMTSEEALTAWNEGNISNDQLKEYIAQKDKLPDEIRKYEITLEALQAQKQDVLNQIQAIESTNQSAPVLVQTSFVSPDASEQPAYTTQEAKGNGLSQKAKAIIILCVAAVLIIVIAAVASNSRKEKEAANSTQPVVGQTVYWNRQKYHSRPDCPMIYREVPILEKEYTQNVDDSDLCSWCWEHQNDD